VRNRTRGGEGSQPGQGGTVALVSAASVALTNPPIDVLLDQYRCEIGNGLAVEEFPEVDDRVRHIVVALAALGLVRGVDRQHVGNQDFNGMTAAEVWFVLFGEIVDELFSRCAI
jgi:hypothetical protein